MTKISQGSADDTRRLILIRHAHRDNSIREVDNGLSDTGKAQALAIAKRFTEPLSIQSVILESSPKLRCQETIAPLANNLKTKVSINSLLDEQLPQETRSVFESRIHDYLEAWRKSGIKMSMACSHGDWIPAALKECTGLHMDLGKSGWVILTHHANSGWSIEETVLQVK